MKEGRKKRNGKKKKRKSVKNSIKWEEMLSA